MPRRCRSANATPWISARPPNAIARWARHSTSSRPIFKFQQAGVRHLILDFVGPYEERDQQIERFAAEAMPLLAGLRGRR